MDRFISNDLVDFSFPFKSDDYVVGHMIEPRTKADSSSIQKLFNVLAPSVSFFVSFLVANLVYFFWLFLMAVVAKKCFDLRKRRTKVGAKKLIAKFKAYRVLFVSYVLMNFLVMQLISNNLSTEKVIVDVSGLLHSEEAIKATKRTACFLGLKHFFDSNFKIKHTILS